MPAVTLEQATKLALAALDQCRADGAPKATVVVTDAGGHIRVALRADGVGNFGVQIAHAKCKSAAGFGRSTMALSQGFPDPSKVAGLTAAVGGDFLPIGGGVPLFDGDGVLIGAAAVAGGAPEDDERRVLAGVAAAGLKTA